MTDVAKRGSSRVWVMDGGAGPTITPELLLWAAAQATEKNNGDIERIEVPSQTQHLAYDAVDEIQSGEENATLGLMLTKAMEPSRIFEIFRKKCIADFQVHFGRCTDPRDFDSGWESGYILAYERGRLTTYSTDELGSLTSEDESKVSEELELSAREFYQIGPLTFSERARSEVAQEIIKILVCDSISCGDCENPSDGCQKVFAIAAPAGSSPGVLPEVVVSTNGMSTIAQESVITTLAIGEDPDDGACVGDNLVVVSQDSTSLHYAALADLADGDETWAEVTTGFTASKGPRAIDSYGPFDTWIGGAGGYIYYTTDPTSGVEAKDEGSATTQDINDIYAYTADIVIAVGESNAVVYTVNGADFVSVTGPAVGVALTAVFARTDKEWWVGTGTGRLYYTSNRGTTWTEKSFPGSGAGRIDDIVFASNMVGFIAHASATPAGRILRTINGGKTWKVLPDGSSSMPANDRFNSLAVCKRNVNTVYAAGLADNAADGVIVKGTTSYFS